MRDKRDETEQNGTKQKRPPMAGRGRVLDGGSTGLFRKPKTLGGFHDGPNVEVNAVSGTVLHRAFEVGVVDGQGAVGEGPGDGLAVDHGTVAVVSPGDSVTTAEGNTASKRPLTNRLSGWL